MTENPDAPREPVFQIAPIVLAAIAAMALLQALRSYLLSPEADWTLLEALAFFPAKLFAGPASALPSLFTHSLLHGGWTHLIVNSVWLAAFGSPLAWRIGTWRFIAFWAVTAAIGALAVAISTGSENYMLVGASGAVSGTFGAAARLGFAVDRRARPPAFSAPLLTIGQALRRPSVLQFTGLWIVINFVAGAGLLGGPEGMIIAWQAHLGGFAAGFFGMALFDGPARRG